MNLRYIKCPAFMCFGNLTSPSFWLSGTPILWLRENGATCPFGWHSVEATFVQFEANPCDEADSGLVGFSLVCRYFGCLWVLPKLTVSFLTPIMALSTFQKHYIWKENAQFWGYKYYNTWEEQKDKWFHFHTCTSQYTHLFHNFCAPGTHTTKKTSPGLPCASLEPELRNKLIRICGPPTPQNTQQMLVCNWCGREFSVIPPQLILQTFFLCNRLRGMSLHISEN